LLAGALAPFLAEVAAGVFLADAGVATFFVEVEVAVFLVDLLVVVEEACALAPSVIKAAAKTSARLLKLFIVLFFNL